MQCITAQPQGLRFGQRALMQPATLQPSTAELLEQRNGPIGSLKGHLTRQPLLKATAGIRAQANAAGAATHRLRREHRRL